MSVFQRADILLPRDADMEKWAVIACDQFTSDRAYWDRVRGFAGDSASTIHMILPEAELGSANEAALVCSINHTMERYLNEGVFSVFPDCYIYVERMLQNGAIRKGLIGKVDLEGYDYSQGSESLIRATEKTVVERIPPRQRVRRGASIEFPHVLMLADDDGCALIEPVGNQKSHLRKLYDFDLMEGGGHITGWLVDGKYADAFDAAFSDYSAHFAEKYADLDDAKVLLAVGDGNHSLATAKSCFEELKKHNPGKDLSNHPARFALVELENIHDPAQEFEPVHRTLSSVNGNTLLKDLASVCAPGGYPVEWIMGNERGTFYLDREKGELAVAVLQNFLDHWMAVNGGSIDYIHGEESAAELAQEPDSISFLLPAMGKSQLFRGVIAGGILPRKTFSMGHAQEKRYYLEGRKIK